MKILLYSVVFWPSVGGVETITDTLATNIVELGHSCTVVTDTPSQNELPRNYEVVRQPSFIQKIRLIRSCDLVHSNGASMALFFHARLCRKPFVWTHNGYQVSCIDGLGWVDGQPAPINPWGSIKFHYRYRGLPFAVKGALNLTLRRLVARWVDLNIAATLWVAHRQPLRRQVQSYTPYPLSRFEGIPSREKKYDFIYVGRLVSEKGVATLLKAFARLIAEPTFHAKSLLVVGDGSSEASLRQLSVNLHLDQHVEFCGRKTGDELLNLIAESEIAVVPSEWEEPMGGVALELLSAGKNIIVSRDGGMSECVGDAGLIFANGDDEALYCCMKTMASDDALRLGQKERASSQVKQFSETELTKNYLKIYEKFVGSRRR